MDLVEQPSSGLAPMPNNRDERVFQFGAFVFHPRQRSLTRNGERVAIGARAIDVLAVLLETPGELVPKATLLDRVWPNIHVDETSLRVHMSALRKALQNDDPDQEYIVTVPGRGYSFIAPLEGSERGIEAPTSAAAGKRRAIPLPRSLVRVLGRETAIEQIVDAIDRKRCVSIVGSGGIGKTTLALAVAESIQKKFGVATFVDLSPVEDPVFVPARVAAAFDIALSPDDPLAELGEALNGQDILIILDNCEHVIAAAADLVDGLLRRTDRLQVLATSREPLRVAGEWVQRLDPLGLPVRRAEFSVADAMRSPAVQLFVERAAEGLGGFELDEDTAMLVAGICRDLDGVALAIEFAAARVGSLGVTGLAAQLANRFAVLRSGNRTALPRQRTLRAMLDWSYDLLSDEEKTLLQRISYFQSSFDLGAASAVCSDGELPPEAAADTLCELVAKSLVVAAQDAGSTRYRLLDTTRAYGRQMLDMSGDVRATAERHARHLLSTFDRLSPGREPFAFLEGDADEAPEIEELRRALQWAFSDDGDKRLGVALTVAGLPLWWQLSSIDESFVWVERALAACGQGVDADPYMQMVLHSALGGLQMYAVGRVRDASAEWQRTYDLAVMQNDVEFQLRALRALWSMSINRGEFARALAYGQDFRRLAETAGMTREAALAGRFIGTAEHFMGRHAAAEASNNEMLSGYVGVSREDIVRFQFDQRISARLVSGRIPAIRGMFDTALSVIAHDVGDAVALGHTLTLCCLLSQSACPIALLAEDDGAFDYYQALLRERAASPALTIWSSYADCFEAQRKIARGDAQAGLSELLPAMERLSRSGFNHFLTSFLLAEHDALFALGRLDEANLSLAAALEICDRTGEAWLLPELIRAKGRHAEGSDIDLASQEFQQAIDLAKAQGAVAWELRAATNLTRLEFECRNSHAADQILSDAIDRCPEGHKRTDFLKASSLLATIKRPRELRL